MHLCLHCVQLVYPMFISTFVSNLLSVHFLVLRLMYEDYLQYLWLEIKPLNVKLSELKSCLLCIYSVRFGYGSMFYDSQTRIC